MRKGEFLVMKYSLQRGVGLRGWPVGGGTYSGSERIEKVVLLAMENVKYSFELVVPGREKKELHYFYVEENKSVIVKIEDLMVNEEFELNFRMVQS